MSRQFHPTGTCFSVVALTVPLLSSALWVANAHAGQYLPERALQALRLRRLRNMVAYAARHVPLYRRLWSSAGVGAHTLESLADLSRFPVPDRRLIEEDPRAVVSDEHLPLYDSGQGYIRRSGGSSGGPQLEVHSDEASWTRLDGFYYRAFGALGYRPWHPLAYYWGAPFRKRSHNALGLMPKIGVPASLDEASQLAILEQNPGCWWYYHPTSLFPLVRRFPERARRTTPARVITHAELLPHSMRRQIELGLGVPVYDQYGTSEFNRMAWQCPARDGYHVDADSVILEIVDDEGRPTRSGETGRAIATGLINRMMPLIRYELGDLLVATDRPCDCGRTLPLIAGIEGRMKDRFVLPGGALRTPREVLEPFADVPGVELFRVTQKTPDTAELCVVSPAEDFASVARECEARFASVCPGLSLTVKRVSDIEKAVTGKRVLIRNELALPAKQQQPVFTL